ncbi:MAG: LysM peptidoglycan-binding domain-containing protein [Chloroflexi bacterium]|nr:LysM peptidoglycan-binding domain-containing protein [Chloroflexota bacterium]
MRRYWILFTAVILCLTPLSLFAQAEEPPTPPPPADTPIPLVHIVQAGENLTIIATNYGITVEELLALNNLTNADVLAVGQQLIIPGSTGEAVATVYTVQAGDTIGQVAALFNTTSEKMLAANSIVNPNYQPAIGETVTVVSRTGSALPQPVTGRPHLVVAGETVSTIAAQYGVTPAILATANRLPYPAYLFPGQRLRIPGEAAYTDLPGEWVQVDVRPLPIQQGSTVSIYVQNLLTGQPSGSFAGQPLRFFPYEDGFVALAGIDAFTKPGLYTLELSGSGDRPWRPFAQKAPINSSGFGIQLIPIPDDPIVRQEEDAFLASIYNQTDEAKAWDGLFQLPVTTTVVTAPYGDGRSYDGSPINNYHTGVDFAGGVGAPILAPANGKVVFADLLELRGNSVILDHGLGVMTAYFHLSEIFVALGNDVVTGQPLGAGGSTGLSTGPHLHWDVRVNNVPVNGVQWTEVVYP